jgi:nucleoside-diphosphate-sugar epimerase
MKPIILGNGLLGTEFQKQTSWDILSRKKNQIEATDINKWLNLLNPYNTIINCIANTDTYSNVKKLHWDVNYKFVSELVDYCNEYDKKLIHISTDYVYANSLGIPTEEDIPVHQATYYAYTKLLADGYIELKSKNYLILRGTHKPTPFPYKGAWINQFGNFDYVDVIASMMIKLIKKDICGVFNIGTELKSMYSLALKTNLQVNPIYNTDERIPLNNIMNINKYKKYE